MCTRLFDRWTVEPNPGKLDFGRYQLNYSSENSLIYLLRLVSKKELFQNIFHRKNPIPDTEEVQFYGNQYPAPDTKNMQ